jgi:hypothetical protein
VVRKRPYAVESNLDSGSFFGGLHHHSRREFFGYVGSIVDRESEMRRVLQRAHRGRILEHAGPIPQRNDRLGSRVAASQIQSERHTTP